MEKYVGECLDSILAQTFQNFEVIVVDDYSSDKSCAVVKKYLPLFNKNDDKLRLIESKKIQAFLVSRATKVLNLHVANIFVLSTATTL